ncbi:MAG TPA: Lsr2 family protein [Streptosporangiaceae bacterium]|nr:Lsr2 family protein [Streptosporangiaceae bacterium]
MAQRVMTSFVDDIDGSAAEGTVRFALDGDEYEIDLNARHAAALRKVLAPYVSAGRKAAVSRRPARRGRREASGGVNTTEVREWARSQGLDVKERGRIPAELVVKFQAAAAG